MSAQSLGTRYVIKPKADRDLDDYADYIANEASMDVALRFFDAVHGTFALLATQPNMGWQPRLQHAGLAGLRVFRVTGFHQMIILYRPLTEGVDILRVIHGSRNLRSLLRREGID